MLFCPKTYWRQGHGQLCARTVLCGQRFDILACFVVPMSGACQVAQTVLPTMMDKLTVTIWYDSASVKDFPSQPVTRATFPESGRVRAESSRILTRSDQYDTLEAIDTRVQSLTLVLVVQNFHELDDMNISIDKF